MRRKALADAGKGVETASARRDRWQHLALIPRYTINYYIRITHRPLSFPPVVHAFLLLLLLRLF